MNKVIIIGAGFSIDAGVPRQSEIIPQILKTNEGSLEMTSASIVKDFKIVKTILLPYLYGNKYKSKPSLLLLEDIYSLLDNTILRQKNLGFIDHTSLIQIRSSLDNCVSYVINKKIPEEIIDSYRDKLNPVFEENHEISFISTNWDTLLETVLTRIGFDINLGLKDLEKKSIQVLKPHGSLDWKWCPVCDRFYPEASELFKCHKCENIYRSKLNQLLFKLTSKPPTENSLLPVFITPTFLKNSTLLIINEIFQKMLITLSNADIMSFIGYSLPFSDHDIRELLMKSNTIRNKRKVEVVLKESNSNRREQLKNNFRSIYSEDNLEFKWTGF